MTSPPGAAQRGRAAKGLLSSGRTLATALPQLARQAATPLARTLTGPIGPHRRWAWTDAQLDEFKQVRAALGGTLNDVVLTAITRGFRDLLTGPRRAVRAASSSGRWCRCRCASRASAAR